MALHTNVMLYHYLLIQQLVCHFKLQEKIGNPNQISQWVLSYKTLVCSVLLDVREGGDQYSRNIADVQRNGVVIETAEFRFQADNVTQTTLFVSRSLCFRSKRWAT
jgi:hypothetical protein